MGRRARIAKVECDGTVRSIHCQWASIENVGKTLQTFLFGEDDVDKLIGLGDISSLQALPRYKFDSDKHIMVQEVDDEMTVVVASRVRVGQIDTDASLNAFLDNPTYDRERSFVYLDSEWLVTSTDIDNCMVPIRKMMELMDSAETRYYPVRHIRHITSSTSK